MRCGRLLDDVAADGPWNMGVDEALLASAAQRGVASLRFYRWRGPWVSLGYAQRWCSERERSCAQVGVGVVQRSTGGRAVLHGCDLTYSVALPLDWEPSSLIDSYGRISRGLVSGLGALGVAVEASAAAAEPLDRGVFDCFRQPAAHELCVAGRKLAGSAQRRSRGALLQHGSIRLRRDPESARRASGLATVATSLAEEGYALDESELRGALGRGLGDALGIEWRPGDLTRDEREGAQRRASHYVEAGPRSGAGPRRDASRASLSGR